jgi:hypothetical protein
MTTSWVLVIIIWIIALAMIGLVYVIVSRPAARYRYRRDRERAAHMPAELIAGPPRHAGDLAAGETAYILAAHVDVEPDGASFLRASIDVRDTPEGIYQDKIERVERGIRLALRAGGLPAYRRETLSPVFYTSLKYLPVVEITIEPPAANTPQGVPRESRRAGRPRAHPEADCQA